LCFIGEIMSPAHFPIEPPVVDLPKPAESPTPPQKEGFSYYLSLFLAWGKARIHIALGKY
jgi:hypothetical protein